MDSTEVAGIKKYVGDVAGGLAQIQDVKTHLQTEIEGVKKHVGVVAEGLRGEIQEAKRHVGVVAEVLRGEIRGQRTEVCRGRGRGAQITPTGREGGVDPCDLPRSTGGGARERCARILLEIKNRPFLPGRIPDTRDPLGTGCAPNTRPSPEGRGGPSPVLCVDKRVRA